MSVLLLLATRVLGTSSRCCRKFRVSPGSDDAQAKCCPECRAKPSRYFKRTLELEPAADSSGAFSDRSKRAGGQFLAERQFLRGDGV